MPVHVVEYTVISTLAGFVRVLPDGGNLVVAYSDDLSSEQLTAFLIADYLTRSDVILRPGEKKALRVTYRVLGRLAEAVPDFGELQVRALEEIAESLAPPPPQPKRAPNKDTPPAPELAAAPRRAPNRSF